MKDKLALGKVIRATNEQDQSVINRWDRKGCIFLGGGGRGKGSRGVPPILSERHGFENGRLRIKGFSKRKRWSWLSVERVASGSA